MSTALPVLPADLDEATKKLLQAQHHTPVLISLFDRNDQLLWANPAFRKSFGLGDNDYPTWHDMMVHSQSLGIGTHVQTDDLEHWLTSARSRQGKLPYRGIEADLRDGRWIFMTETVCADGCMLCIGSDISHLRHDERLLRLERDLAVRAALTDPLTGLSNRAHIMALLDKQIQQVQQGKHTCGLALLDLDYFKRVNDSYGHEAGDTVLRHFAQLLPQVLRREDCHGRIGGEEFLLLLPNVTLSELCSCVQRLIDMLPLHRPLEDSPEFFYTTSAGVTLISPEDTATHVMRRADIALYQAKHKGRSRMVFYQASDLDNLEYLAEGI